MRYLIVAAILLWPSCATTKAVEAPDLLDATLECKHHRVWYVNGMKHENCD